ncbi:hypothetical protein Metbo_0264 [Methanobacterium lacus]|uniref:Uncharacterized protein n=1 Tax=Methanobacterium lacus (strain AL-21) TaxID=877455 RepID=F0T8A4_METLA|nr:hypothetical protein Metbo_0264 [Methanobacterium lacus]
MLSEFSLDSIKVNTQLKIPSQFGVYRVNPRLEEGVK